MTRQRKAMLMMVITACLWSIGGIFLKLVSWNAFLITGSRSLLAAGVLGGYMYFSKTKFKINKYSIAAAVSLAGLLFCFVTANKLTTAANAIILQYTAPIFILIISILFLKHQIHKKEVIIVTVTAIGIVFFFFDQLSPGNILGNMLAILAGLLLAIMFLAVGFGGGEDDSVRLSSMLIGHLLTAVIGIPIGLPLTESFAMSEVICIIILGIVQLGIPYVLYAIASKDCSPLACSLIGMIEPILNPVWVFIFAGEMPGFYALVGGAIVIAAVTIWCVIGESGEEEQ